MLHAEILSSLFQAIKPWSRRNPEVAVNGFFFSAFLNDIFWKSVLQLHMKVLIKIWGLANLRHFWRAFKLSRLQEPVELFTQLGTSETWPSATLRQKWLNEKKHHSPTLIQKAVLSSISNICLLVPLLLYLCFLSTSYSTLYSVIFQQHSSCLWRLWRFLHHWRFYRGLFLFPAEIPDPKIKRRSWLFASPLWLGCPESRMQNNCVPCLTFCFLFFWFLLQKKRTAASLISQVCVRQLKANHEIQ